MTNKPTSEAGKQAEWELAFDERFDHFNELYIGSDQPGVINHPDIGKQICSVDCEKNSDLNDVKEFIRTLLAKERQRMVEEIQREADIVQEVKLESGVRGDISEFRLVRLDDIISHLQSDKGEDEK